MSAPFVDKIEMQHRLFAELSRMFGQEVPLYDKSLLVNRACNQTVCALMGKIYPGFRVSDAQLDKTSGERHGAIRIGKPEEYRWIARYFAAFAMLPHNYYDMTNVGAKSQPIIATAFRSVLNPEHRVFTSLLMTDYFDPQTRARIEALLATREVFSDRAKALIEKNEKQGGLDSSDADALIREGVDRIFKWTGKARDHQLYQDLCAAGFKIAADIACFGSHHLNHLTPNTFCMDLYTAAMKFCLGELDEAAFRLRAQSALDCLTQMADKDYLRLTFRHFKQAEMDAFEAMVISSDATPQLVAKLAKRLQEPDLALSQLKHAGFKDFTEGPPVETTILLRQDAYKALTEPVQFQEADGTTINTVHTARFGEIEQRGYATTLAGRKLYDTSLAEADADRDKNPALAKKDFKAYEAMTAGHFKGFPTGLPELLARKLVLGRYSATPAGIAANGTIKTTDLNELVTAGYVRFEGLRYEDFLPVSAAGIFASNLSQYGTKSTAAQKPAYPQSKLEEILGRKIVDSNVVYAGLEAESLQKTYAQLGLLDKLPAKERTELEQRVSAYKASQQ